VKIEPQDPAHLIALGAQQLAEGQADQALATWQRLLRVSPDKAEAYATLGGVLADHDMLQEAEDAYREAVRRDSDELAYVRGLAGVLERPRAGESERAPQARARETEALKLWRRVLDLAAEDRVARREARRRIVGIWARRRELSRRMQRWRRAFQDEPPDVDAGRFLAEAYLRSRPRRLERAETVLERVVELDPGDVESLLALERARTARGDLVGAIAALQRLVDADPRRAPRYLQRMAEHSLALYRDEQAVEFAERAVKRTPDDASAHRRLGDLYRARQDMEEAIASYRRALELNDHLFSTYFDLAELHMARGEREEADRLFRTVVRTSPDDDLVSRAARASIQIHLGEGTLEALERDLLPLALGHPRRPIFRKLLVELYDALTKPWIRAVRGDAETSDEAREQLDRLGGRAIKPLLEALADSDPAQQRVAVDVLAHVGNEHAAGPLLAAAEESGEAGLRTEALVAAGAIAGPDKVERFVELARGTDRTLRGVATWALGRIGGRRAVRALRALVAADDPAVRAFAALGLGHVSDRPSAESLERLAREDRSVQVRAAAAWALGRAGDARHVPSLIAMMRGGDGLLAAAAASALGALGDRRAVETLARALFDPDPEQRASGARAIRRLARPGASQPAGFPLPRHSAAPDAYLRDLLELEASGEPAIELASLRGALEQAARDAFEGPVERATTALTVLTGPGRFTVTPLVGDLDAWPEPARAEAHETLARLGRSLLPSLADLLDHPDAAVREHAIRAVSFVEGAAATRALGASLDDAHPPVQRAALRALASRGTAEDEGVVRRIVDLALEHPDWSTRMRAVEALAPQEVALVVEPLEEALATDPYAFVREAAARALGNYRAKAAPALRRAANSDVEARVRAAARAALEGGSAPVPHAERAGGSGEAATGP
jgi:HEAT repeat protein/predicted negative regulator of RcsB-dependent stress response